MLETSRMRAAPSEPKDETSPKEANPFANIHVGQRWREIQGSNDWVPLLDPIDSVLRAEIVRYGEFAQACYDAFETDRNSTNAGNSQYSKDELLEKVGLDNRGYEITHFLYATAHLLLPSLLITSTRVDNWCRDSNWMGFVAVCTSPQEIARLGRRDILVAWRGTQKLYEWIKDVQDYSEPSGFLPESDPRYQHILVESGFLNVYTSNKQSSLYNKSSVREQVRGAVKDLVKKYRDEGPLSITITGHSLGSALATLCAYDMAESQINLQEESDNMFQRDKIPITVFSFAGPKVGNEAFRERVHELGVKVLRVANKRDIVTKVPGVLFRPIRGKMEKILPMLPWFKHVGTTLKIDFRKAIFLDFLVSHNLEHANAILYNHLLEVYIHVVDGFHGNNLPFEPTFKHIALVKGRNLLNRAENHIPASWWQEGKKDRVQDKNGHWVVPESNDDMFSETPTPQEEFLHCVSIAEGRSNNKSGKDPVVVEQGSNGDGRSRRYKLAERINIVSKKFDHFNLGDLFKL